MTIAWRCPACSRPFAELVATYGEEAAAKYADSLSKRIRNGEFTVEIVAPVAQRDRRPPRADQAEQPIQHGIDILGEERLVEKILAPSGAGAILDP